MVETDARVSSVRNAIRENLAAGGLTIDRCAQQLGLSRRTLQRLLYEAGLTFTCLVDQVRLEVATKLLTDDKQKVADIAGRLGYATPANFARAFQRLAGVTPTEFRRRIRYAKDAAGVSTGAGGR
jgi:AraC-like DNA-binding protein